MTNPRTLSPDSPPTEAAPAPVTEAAETEPECRHWSIVTWRADREFGEGPRLWACEDCGRRFYPACPTCVTVGHRNEAHAEAAAAAGTLDVERLARALCATNVGHYRGWDADLSHATVEQDHLEEATDIAAAYLSDTASSTPPEAGEG